MSDSKNRFNRPVMILGTPFSGISQVAELFYKHGLWMGKSGKDWDIANPKFHFENPVLRSQINQKILGIIEADPFRIDKIPEISELPTTSGLKPVIRNIVRKQGYDGSGLWGFKDYRLSLVWPVWQKEFPDATWIVVKRSPSKIIETCLKIRGTRKISLHEHYWYNWCEIYHERLQALQLAVSHCYEIDANALEYGDIEQFQQLMGVLGLKFDKQITQQHFKPVYQAVDDSINRIN